MATTPTQLPVPSETTRDIKFNAGKIDEFVTSTEAKYVDRLGGEHYTVDGIRQNLIPLSRQYMTLAEAQADIANIPSGTTTYVRNADGSSLADEYINNDGTLESTGRKMPSQQAIDDVYSFIAENDILSPGRNIYNYRTSLDGKYLNEQGVISDNPIYFLSDYMMVSPAMQVASNYNLRFVHFFDDQNNLLSYLTFVTQFTTPSNARYIRITGGIDSKTLLQIEAGPLKTAFKYYREYISETLPDGTPVSAKK